MFPSFFFVIWVLRLIIFCLTASVLTSRIFFVNSMWSIYTGVGCRRTPDNIYERSLRKAFIKKKREIFHVDPDSKCQSKCSSPTPYYSSCPLAHWESLFLNFMSKPSTPRFILPVQRRYTFLMPVSPCVGEPQASITRIFPLDNATPPEYTCTQPQHICTGVQQAEPRPYKDPTAVYWRWIKWAWQWLKYTHF